MKLGVKSKFKWNWKWNNFRIHIWKWN